MGALSDAFVGRLTSCVMSVAYIGPKSRTKRPRKTKIGTGVAHVTPDLDTAFRVKSSRSPGHFCWLFRSLHNVYRRNQSLCHRCLLIMNIHGARCAGRRKRKACRLWTGGGLQWAGQGHFMSPLAQLVHDVIITIGLIMIKKI